MGEHSTDERARAEQSAKTQSDEVEQTLEQQDAEVAAAWRSYLLQLDDGPLRRPDSSDDDEAEADEPLDPDPLNSNSEGES